MDCENCGFFKNEPWYWVLASYLWTPEITFVVGLLGGLLLMQSALFDLIPVFEQACGK